MVAVSPLYYSYEAAATYCSVLVVTMLLNAGQFYGYKMKKLEAAEMRIEELEGRPDDEEAPGFFDMEKEDKKKSFVVPRRAGNKRRNIATVIRTVDAWTLETEGGGGFGREYRAKMAEAAQGGGRRVKVHDNIAERDTEESAGVLAAQRREQQRRSARPEIF
jgi:hypothetical protein